MLIWLREMELQESGIGSKYSIPVIGFKHRIYKFPILALFIYWQTIGQRDIQIHVILISEIVMP